MRFNILLSKIPTGIHGNIRELNKNKIKFVLPGLGFWSNPKDITKNASKLKLMKPVHSLTWCIRARHTHTNPLVVVGVLPEPKNN
jgi:hypothetical protein